MECFADPFNESSGKDVTPPGTTVNYQGYTVSEGSLTESFDGGFETSTFVTYTFSPPISVSAAGFSITFSKVEVSQAVTLDINVINPGGGIETVTATLSGTIEPLVVNISGPYTVNEIEFDISTGSNSSTVTLYSFTSSLCTCVSPQTKVLTLSGYKEIQDIQRGEILPQGKVARIIETPLSPNSLVEITKLKKNSLEGGLPLQDLLVCSNHGILYKNKIYLAKNLGGYTEKGLAKDLLQPSKDGKYKLLDIQFDFEGFYTISGLESQSRSPYCKLTSLPKELYFNQENYKDILVENTLQEYLNS